RLRQGSSAGPSWGWEGGFLRDTENGARFKVIGVTATLDSGQAAAAVRRVQAWPSSDSTRVRLSVRCTWGLMPKARLTPGTEAGRLRLSNTKSPFEPRQKAARGSNRPRCLRAASMA